MRDLEFVTSRSKYCINKYGSLVDVLVYEICFRVDASGHRVSECDPNECECSLYLSVP